MFEIKVKKGLDKIFFKMSRKNPLLLEIIDKKTKQLRQDPYRFKSLRKPLQNKRRVHIGKSFVLIYSINGKTVLIEDFDHHDNVYK